MRVGLLFDLRNPAAYGWRWPDVYAQALDWCVEADRLGAGGLWFTEHHRFEDGYLPQPLTFAAAAAARTTQARIGTAVLLPALRKPAQLAEEAAVVDLISGGRLELGMGTGYRVPEYELFEVDIRERFRRTESSIGEVRRLWAENGVAPRPAQPEVPMWGGFYGPRGASIAGRLGIGLLHISRTLFGTYREALVAAGHDPARAAVSGLQAIVLADDPEAAWPRIAPHLAHQQDTYNRHRVEGTDEPLPEPVDPDALRRPPGGGRPAFQVLTPQVAAAQLRSRTEGLPVEHLIFWARIGAMPSDVVERHIELVCTDLRKLLA